MPNLAFGSSSINFPLASLIDFFIPFVIRFYKLFDDPSFSCLNNDFEIDSDFSSLITYSLDFLEDTLLSLF